MARREEQAGGFQKNKKQGRGQEKKGGKDGKGRHDSPADIRRRQKVEEELRVRRMEPKVPSDYKPKLISKRSAKVEVKRYIEGGVHALLGLPKDTREVNCVVPDRNGNKAEFSAVGGGFPTGEFDEMGHPVYVEFVEIRLVSAEVGNPLRALPSSAKVVFITPGQVMASPEKFTRQPSWTDEIYNVRLALREYLREAREYTRREPLALLQNLQREREVPAILKPAPIVEPKLVPEPQMAKLEAVKNHLEEEDLRAGATRNVSGFMLREPGKYQFGGVYLELKRVERVGKSDTRINLLCVDEGTSFFDKLGQHRGIGFSFAQLEGSAVLPLILREGQEPRQVAVRFFLVSLRDFLVKHGFKVRQSAEEPKMNGNGSSNELRAISIDDVRREEVGAFEFEGVSLKTKMVKGVKGEVAAVHVIAVPQEHVTYDELKLVADDKLYIPVYLVEKFATYPREKVKRPEEKLDALEVLFNLMRRAFGFEVNQPVARNLLAEASSKAERGVRAPQYGH